VSLPLLKRSQFLSDYTSVVLSLQEVNPLAAHRFCDEVDAAVKLISTHPEVARKAGFTKAPEVRIWPVRRFSVYVILYRIIPDHVIALRLLHGAQDLSSLIPNE
jgi:plasmid stabilization system protein ParE